jgi:ABC-2 type transport system permease protein
VIRLHRLRALIGKELRELSRDRVALTIALAGPLLLMLLFGYGVSLDTERVPVAIVIERSTPETRDLAAAFGNARYFRSVFFHRRELAEQALAAGEVAGAVVVASDFTRTVLARGDAPVQVLVDGADARTGRMVARYAEGAVASWLGQRLLTRQTESFSWVQVQARMWFNAEAKSRNFIVPGVIALILSVSGTLLAALIVAREWERGTMEALLATPVLAGELILARTVSYLVLGLGGTVLTVALSVTVVEVPFRGSFLILALAASLFMLTALSLGFLVSGATRNRIAAGRLSLTTSYLPTIMLSGLLFDLRNAPEPIQWISHLVPARYFVSLLHTLFLAGNVWPVLLPDLAGLASIAAVLLLGVVRLNRKRLG